MAANNEWSFMTPPSYPRALVPDHTPSDARLMAYAETTPVQKAAPLIFLGPTGRKPPMKRLIVRSDRREIFIVRAAGDQMLDGMLAFPQRATQFRQRDILQLADAL